MRPRSADKHTPRETGVPKRTSLAAPDTETLFDFEGIHQRLTFGGVIRDRQEDLAEDNADRSVV